MLVLCWKPNSSQCWVVGRPNRRSCQAMHRNAMLEGFYLFGMIHFGHGPEEKYMEYWYKRALFAYVWCKQTARSASVSKKPSQLSVTQTAEKNASSGPATASPICLSRPFLRSPDPQQHTRACQANYPPRSFLWNVFFLQITFSVLEKKRHVGAKGTE